MNGDVCMYGNKFENKNEICPGSCSSSYCIITIAAVVI